jgi:hypothetical protein
MCGAGNNAGLHAFFMSKIKINFQYEAYVNLLNLGGEIWISVVLELY